jgi:hypothetical protein
MSEFTRVLECRLLADFVAEVGDLRAKRLPRFLEAVAERLLI